MGRIERRLAICEAIRSGEYKDHQDLIALINESENILYGDEYRAAVEQVLAMNKKQASIYFERLGGRKGLSDRVIKIVDEIQESGSLKRAVAGAGQLKALAEVAEKADDYWKEVMNRGQSSELFYLGNNKAIPPILGDDGRLSREHWEAEKRAGIS